MSEKKPRQLFKERYERVMTAISIKEPDRVPITPSTMFYPTEQVGMSKKEAMYNLEKTTQAFIDICTPLNWDLMPRIEGIFPGQLFDLTGVKFFKWPGAADENQRLPDHLPFQYVEGEYMKGDEYDELFDDPTGFILRKLVPRMFNNLQGFSRFPRFADIIGGFGMMFSLPLFYVMPETSKLNESLYQAGKALFEYVTVGNNYESALKKLGFPIGITGAALAPFDIISDLMRGMRGSMLDMYRKPEELKKLSSMLINSQINLVVRRAQMASKNKIIFIPLHRGADGFMSPAQFEEFYWPGLTQVMEGLIKNRLIPAPFFEGGYNQRLEYLTEFARKHKGKLIFWFDKTDIRKAKELFGDYACIRGNIPGSLLVTGNPHQVAEYTKQRIEDCAEGGGYLVDGGVAGIPDNAKAENVKAMTDVVFKYGEYRK
ncbi:MAG: uroporphyrinogen decarboxylase family protein [Candidatus Hodarchaeota archaeon]